MKKIFLLLIAVLSIHLSGFAQTDLPTITPPSPEATSLAKFTEIPVSYYTGIPNISIPIYTIQEKGFNIPISLNYHARGILVGEISSRVGLGWALNYGGSISRQIRGVADESRYGYLTMDYYKDIFTDTAVRNNIYTTYTNFPGELDFDPDLFYFNANGLSGKFLFDQKDKQPVIQKYDDLKVKDSIINGEIASFIITDQHGNKYYYGISKDGLRIARNEDRVLHDCVLSDPGTVAINSNNDQRYYNAWQLMDIETLNGDIIEYYYELETSTFYRRSYDKLEDGGVLKSYFSEIESDQYQLKEIKFSNGKLVFTKTTIQREDLTNSFALNKIELFNTNNQFIKKYELDFEYTTSAASNNQLSYLITADPKANKRLFLKSIQQKDESGNSIPPYTFDYNSMLLPSRFSNSQDIWGYYNGANNGRFLTFYNYGTTTIDRKVDTIKSQAGILEKIIYPTGGYTLFTYEHNKAVPTAAFKNLLFNSINPAVRVTDGLSNLENQLYYNGRVYLKPITIGPNIVGDIDVSVAFTDDQFCSSSSNMPDCKFEVSIYNKTINYPLYLGNSQIDLPHGTYTLKVVPKNHVHDPFNMMDGFNIILDWVEQSSSEEDIIFAAGKRIKKIENLTSNDSIRSFKEYSYLDASGQCSGRVFGLPNFKSLNGDILNPFNVTQPYGSVPGSPLKIAQGNTIGYSNVTEFYGDSENNQGKIEYTFTTFEDSGKYYEFPYHLPTDNEWLRGKNISTTIYQNNNGNYEVKKKIQNEYLYGGTNNANIFVGTPFSYSWPTNPWVKDKFSFLLPLLIFTDELGNYKIYYQNGGSQDLKKTVETDYYDNGLALENSTEYFYDYNNHYQVKSKEIIDSKGELFKTTNYYFTDKNQLSGLSSIASTAIDKLEQEHRFDVIQTELSTNTSLLSKIRNNYKSENHLTLLQKIQTSKGIDSLESRLTYHDYDAYGNPLEVSKKDGTHIVYVWGYDHTKPIAKIENAKQDEFNQDQDVAITNAMTASDNDTSDALEDVLRRELNDLRDAFGNSQVTTYTYDPLIGVTSITDPSGYTSYYVYDDFNRLQYIKNKDEIVLKSYKYNYKVID